jgi:hypothetical protein
MFLWRYGIRRVVTRTQPGDRYSENSSGVFVGGRKARFGIDQATGPLMHIDPGSADPY